MKSIIDYISSESETQIVDEANVKSAEFSIETIKKFNRLPDGYNFLRYDPKTQEVQLVNIAADQINDDKEYEKMLKALDIDDWHGTGDRFSDGDGIWDNKPGECHKDHRDRSWIVL